MSQPDESIYTIAPTHNLTRNCSSCIGLQKKVFALEKLIKVGVTLPSKNIVSSVKTIQKRIVFLEGRCAIRESEGKNAGWDESELSALKWAILCINAAVQFNIPIPDAEDLNKVKIDSLTKAEANKID